MVALLNYVKKRHCTIAGITVINKLQLQLHNRFSPHAGGIIHEQGDGNATQIILQVLLNISNIYVLHTLCPANIRNEKALDENRFFRLLRRRHTWRGCVCTFCQQLPLGDTPHSFARTDTNLSVKKKRRWWVKTGQTILEWSSSWNGWSRSDS